MKLIFFYVSNIDIFFNPPIIFQRPYCFNFWEKKILECFRDWSRRCFQQRADVQIFPDKVCRTSSNKVALIVLTRIFGVWMRRTRNRVTGFVRSNPFFRTRQIRRYYDSLRGPQWMIHQGQFSLFHWVEILQITLLQYLPVRSYFWFE